MNIIQRSLGIIALAIILTGMFSSCKKKKEEEVKDSDTSSAAVHEYASDMENQMIRIADEACRLRPGAACQRAQSKPARVELGGAGSHALHGRRFSPWYHQGGWGGVIRVSWEMWKGNESQHFT